MNIVGLVLTAGNGERFQDPLPKQYFNLNKKPLFMHSVEILSNHKGIDTVRIVINKNHIDLFKKIISNFDIKDEIKNQYILGGNSRQESSLNGLIGISELKPDLVIIHDAARPLLTDDTIDKVLEELKFSKAAIPAIPLTDTLKEVKKNYIKKTFERKNFKLAQTPQGFDYKSILKAHKSTSDLHSFHDDSEVIEQYGIKVSVISGSTNNIKITSKEDLYKAENILNLKERIYNRIGFGFDVHKYKDGNEICLCGIKIPYTKSLQGHSDADVAMHALTDSILGSIGMGDIGDHFPDTNVKWQNTVSSTFLLHANSLLNSKNAEINNIDMTIICEEPKISAFKNEMKKKIAKLLNIKEAQINIKATTTEQLGFLGRKEGIAAQVATSINLYEKK